MIALVTLSGNDENTFKGFYLQARDGSGNQVGTFAPNEEEKIKTHNCGGIKNVRLQQICTYAYIANLDLGRHSNSTLSLFFRTLHITEEKMRKKK
jgi:uncharacterized protein (AIM24 family)